MRWLALLPLLLALSQLPAAAVTVALSGDWQITVDNVPFTITPPAPIVITGEVHADLPVYNPKGNWRKGVYLNAVRAQECSSTGLLLESSVVVKRDTGEVLKRGTDYELDPLWGALGRLEGGGLAAGQKVLVDYSYVPLRLDTIVALPDKSLKLITGTPGVGAILPPDVPAGAVAVANIFHHGVADRLDDSNLYPIEKVIAPPVAPAAEQLLPRTLAKLRAGQEVKIVAWGDSVTAGGGVGATPDKWYQNAFARALGERFPQAKITLLTAGWGGQNSAGYMAAPRGGAKDFVRDVLEPKPDLITMEFVNDAGLSGERLNKQYTDIMQQLHGCGAEVILIAPHLIRPDWLGVKSAKFDTDPRPYVRDLKAFAAANNIALADASTLWCRLWRQGIPYMTMEANGINHPDARGHQLFVDALMALFPPK